MQVAILNSHWPKQENTRALPSSERAHGTKDPSSPDCWNGVQPSKSVVADQKVKGWEHDPETISGLEDVQTSKK